MSSNRSAPDSADAMMRQSLELFAKDPPDSLFQEGYLCALMVFANEGLGIPWDDPALLRCSPILDRMHPGKATQYLRKKFELIPGGRA